jgi:hypothetical protein
MLFTDIVSSTEHASAIGDRAFRDLIQSHHRIVRRALKNNRGREIDTAGDGFLAVFAQPADAIACALEIASAVRAALGIEIRAGIHAGEVEPVGDKVGGIAVHIAARVLSAAGPGQVLVTRTARELASGSEYRFTDLGERDMKGVEEQWRLYAVDTSAATPSAASGTSDGGQLGRVGLTVLGAIAATFVIFGAAFTLSRVGAPSSTPGPSRDAPVSSQESAGSSPVDSVAGVDLGTVAFAQGPTTEILDLEPSLDCFAATGSQPLAWTLLDLTDGGCFDPAWSPDGARIAVAAYTGLAIVSATGGDREDVAVSAGAVLSPRWAPDGQRIAYSDGDRVRVVDLSTGEDVVVAPGDIGRSSPDWSPDGNWILFSQSPEPNFATARDLWVVHPDGSGLTQLTNTPQLSEWRPRWSLDGSRITFMAQEARPADGGAATPGQAEGDYDVYVINADGSGSIRLTDSPAMDVEPAWSPDGRTILFASDREDFRYSLYVVAADGSEVDPQLWRAAPQEQSLRTPDATASGN